MKYLIIVILCSINLYGQKEDTSNADGQKIIKSYEISVFGGLLIDNNFDKPIFGISYNKSHKYSTAHLFELWTFNFQNNYFTTISGALRYNILNKEDFKFYIQAGIGVSLFGFIFYNDIGIHYKNYFVDIRVPKLGIYPAYLNVGIKL